MFYLIIKIGISLVVLPEKYPTEEACNFSGKTNDSSLAGNYHYCIPAPKYGLADKNCRINSNNAVQCDIN